MARLPLLWRLRASPSLLLASMLLLYILNPLMRAPATHSVVMDLLFYSLCCSRE